MDVKDIKFSITTVAIIVIQTVSLVWIYAGSSGKLSRVVEITEEVKKNQEKSSQETNLRMSKMEAEVSEQKVRIAILEAKVHELGIKLFDQ